MKTEKIWKERRRKREKRVIDEQIDRSGIKYEKEVRKRGTGNVLGCVLTVT